MMSLSSWNPSDAIRALGQVDQAYDMEAKEYIDDFEFAQDKANWSGQGVRIGIYCHSGGNYYMHPIAHCLQRAFLAAGTECLLLSERDETSEITLPIVVAPHEFFILGTAPQFMEQAFFERCVAFNTEQLDSQWFETALPFIVRSKATIDINFHSSLVLQKLGVVATHVLPPAESALRDQIIEKTDKEHPFLRSMPPEEASKIGGDLPLIERPLDIFFTGYRTRYRDSIFTRHARFFSEKRTMLIYPQQTTIATPHDRTASQGFVDFETGAGLASLSKIVLNIHRTPFGFFEWQRMVIQGFLQRTAVVAGPGLRSPFFNAGLDYFECATRNLDKLIAWLLDHPDGISAAQQVANRAYQRQSSALSPERVGRFLLSFLSSLAR